jgi:tetratricopeptide (TPR) repeat protein
MPVLALTPACAADRLCAVHSNSAPQKRAVGGPFALARQRVIDLRRVCYRLDKNVSLGVRALAVFGVGIWYVTALAASDWTLVRSPHSEVYTQAGEGSARSLALLVERLHAFFSRAGLPLDHRPPVRVIAFRSIEEYEPYRLRPSAAAYYSGSEIRDYIVMPALGPRDLYVEHEYWHLVMHASNLRLPLWLEEGMAEFFSTVRLGEHDTEGDAELTSRFRTLHAHSWMPLTELLGLAKDSPLRDDREASSVFYAQSWALTDMLLSAPAYGPRFPDFLTAVVSGTPAGSALAAVYAKPLAAIAADLRAWIEKRKVTPVTLPEAALDATGVEVSEPSRLASGMLLADLLATTGKMDRAEALYGELAKEAPDDPSVLAALAAIAHKKGDDAAARRQWRRALDQGLEDDDARYNLAILENNAGEHEAALADLHAMRHIAPARQFQYWTGTAYAANQLGRREEAETAAERARAHATNETERAYADELRMIAQSDVVVQVTRDANGQMRLVHTRTPHGSPDWNPFIEPGDQVRRAEGKLRAIDCGAETVFAVETAAGPLRLTIPDLKHVQMRNAPSEYTCGPQPASEVSVVYAASGPAGGVLRGMEFR